MAIVFADRVKDSSTSTGSGNFTLAGSPPSGFVSFDSAFGHAGNHFYYVIDGGANWEVGEGHLSASTTLVRDTVLASSTGSAVSFPAGTKTVFADMPASWLEQRAVLTADFPRTNDTLTNVTDLTLNLIGGRWYRITGQLAATTGAGSGQFDFGGGSCTATGVQGASWKVDGVNGSITPGTNYFALNQAASWGFGLSDPVNYMFDITVEVNAGGTFIMRFAQEATDASASTLLKYSTITAVDVTP